MIRDTLWIFKRNNYELLKGLKLHKVEIVLQSAHLPLPSDEDSEGLKEYLEDLIWMEKQLTEIQEYDLDNKRD